MLPSHCPVKYDIQRFDGGSAATLLRVSAQAAVPHMDIALVTTLALLLTQIEGSI